MSRPHVTLFQALALMLAVAPAAAKLPERPPDPRRGERLDGRDPASPKPRLARAVPRLLLVVPRVAMRAVAKPVLFAAEHRPFKKARDVLTTDDGTIGLRPVLRYESTIGSGLALRVFDRRTLGRGSLLEARGDVVYGNGYGGQLAIRPIERRYGLTLHAETRDKLRFAGIHGETREELQARGLDWATYGQDLGSAIVDVDLNRAYWLGWELRGGVVLRRFRDGVDTGGEDPISEVFCSDCAMGVVDEMEVPGFADGTRRAVAGTEVRLGHLHRYQTGPMLIVDGDWARGVSGDPSHDLTVIGDARLQIGFGDRAVILRAKGGMVEPLGEAPVPFADLLRLGGSTGVRGMSSQRWRGHTVAIGSLEYRWLIAAFYDVAVFVDYGGAFDRRFDGIGFERMRPSYGAGIRNFSSKRDPWYWTADPRIGFDIAYAPDDGVRVFFSTGL